MSDYSNVHADVQALTSAGLLAADGGLLLGTLAIAIHDGRRL